MEGPSESTGRPAPKTGSRAEGDLQGNITYLPDTHRLLPQSPQAEQGVLCAFLLNAREVGGLCVEQGITADCFHIPAHARIYEVLLELWNAGKPIDLITLTQFLHDRRQLDQVGGAAYVTELFTFMPTAANALHYIEILQEKWVLRQIINVCNEYAKRSYDEQDDVPNLLDEVEQHIGKIARDRFQAKALSMKELVLDAIESIEKLYENRGSITGLATGFADLDKMTDGLHGAEMFVIAARPSMGKTALAMNIAEHVAVDQKKPVAVFSLEMSSQQLVQRLLCSRARVNLKGLKEGFLPERAFPSLTAAAAKLAESKIFIEDTAGLTVLELRAKARRLKTQHDIQLIVIDYLQLLRSATRRAQENRQIEISEISAGVKALAKELGIPVIVLAQLNRNPENREGGKPKLSDLRESGSIEQDADIVALLVREEVYAEDEEKEEAKGKATLFIAKQRNGPIGDVELTFLKEFTRFEDRARSGPEG